MSKHRASPYGQAASKPDPNYQPKHRKSQEGPRVKQTKTIQVATYPDGRKVRIIRVAGLGWHWDRNSYSSHKDSAIEQAKAAGATITREPNPSYREPKQGLAHFGRLMKGIR